MKKLFAILMVVLMLCSFAACGGDDTADKKETEAATQAATESVDVTTAAVEETTAAPAGPVVVTGGETGEGEAQLDAGLFTMTVPEGLKYEVYNYYYTPDNNLATIKIDFGASSTIDGQVNVTTQRMVKSLDEAEAECIRLYKDYDGMTSEVLGEETIGNLTFRKIHITTQYQDKTILAGYYKAEGDFTYPDTLIEITTDTNKIDLADPAIVALIESITLK